MKLHYLQHICFEDLGSIDHWAKKNDFSVTRTAFFNDEPLPHIDDIDWLIILGGPMNIYEDNSYPWLKEEKDFIKKAITQKKIVIGICLGAQLIADALGAKVTKGKYKEIGWFPVKLLCNKTLPLFPVNKDEFKTFHWHTDTFDIPTGANLLACSAACETQAFSYDNNRIIALQFHMELTREGIARLIDKEARELTSNKFIQNKQEILKNNALIEKNNKYMHELLSTVKKLH